MRKTLFSLLLLTVATADVNASGEPRFVGSGALAPATPASADGRFTLTAELNRGDRTQVAGRYVLTANLAASADAKSIATACGNAGADIFKNGFEN